MLPMTREEGRARYAERASEGLRRVQRPQRGWPRHRSGALVAVLEPDGEEYLPARVAPDAWFDNRYGNRRRNATPGARSGRILCPVIHCGR